MKTENYLTPLELMKTYPQVRKLGWSAIKIGIFFSSGMLEGYCCVRERRSMILESSFLLLIEYVNSVNLRKVIKFE